MTMRPRIPDELRRIAIYPKPLPDMDSWLERIGGVLDRRGVEATVVSRDRNGDPSAQAGVVEASDLVLVLGGDGTFLSAARLAAPKDKPVLGVNVGNLGFLAEYESHEWEQALDDLFAARSRIEPRMMVSCAADGEPRGCGLNDVVITKSALARMVSMELLVDGESVSRFSADGLIVSTPVGSTAYNLSAGGPIVQPSEDVLIITPICPHQLNFRPLVVPPDTEITLVVETQREQGYLTIDGQVGWPLEGRCEIQIQRAANPLMLVSGPTKRFYAILREKLGWGGTPAC